MSILLNSQNDTLSINTSSTSEISYFLSYDVSGSNPISASSQGKITTATDTEVVPSPPPNSSYSITNIFIVNSGMSSNVVKIYRIVNGVSYPTFPLAVTLNAGDSIQYDSSIGFKKYYANGKDSSTVVTTVAWGAITGTLSDQTDLQTELNTLQTNINTVQTNVDLKQSIAQTIQPPVNQTSQGPTTNSKNAGVNLTIMDLVVFVTAATWQKTDANTADVYTGLLAVCLETKTSGNAIKVALPNSVIRNDAWNWTVGGIIYMSETAATMTQTAPLTSGAAVRKLGYALTADCIWFSPSAEFTVNP